jgi:heme-degrading monooxygenase HmoA
MGSDLVRCRAGGALTVILEHAVLQAKSGREFAFEAAFEEAEEIIAGMPGFGWLTPSRSIERTGALRGARIAR